MAKSGLFYVHFMGDILVLAPTCWRFQKAVHEQEPGETLASARLGLFVRRWVKWARGESIHGPCEMVRGGLGQPWQKRGAVLVPDETP